MKLVVREYLSMLSEREGLDSLLSDLLLSMGIRPLSRPQIGPRQYGVDLAAFGKDPEDGLEKVFLFTVKAGDIDMTEWDQGRQAVRPSLNEIRDVYIRKNIPAKYKNYPVLIVLCFGGELRQNAQSNWDGYVETETKPGILNFDTWDGDKLAELICRHLMNEFLFPKECRQLLRKSLSMLDEPAEGYRHSSALVEAMWPGETSSISKRLKALRAIHLALEIVFQWGKSEDNLALPYMAGEYTVLRCWDFIKGCKPSSSKRPTKSLLIFVAIVNSFNRICICYFDKVQKHCNTKDGLSKAVTNGLENNLFIHETMGRLAVIGFSQIQMCQLSAGDERFMKNAEAVADTLWRMIQNHPVAYSPVYDGHSTDICLALLLFQLTGKSEYARRYIPDVVGKTLFTYGMGRYFPISTDSYDDLVDLTFNQGKPKEELSNVTTLYPILAQWCLILGDEKTYRRLKSEPCSVLPHTNWQMWYPDEETEKYLFRANAMYASGTAYNSIVIPENMSDLKQEVVDVNSRMFDVQKLSCFMSGLPLLGLIASRHFRTPVIPFYWQQMILPNREGSPADDKTK